VTLFLLVSLSQAQPTMYPLIVSAMIGATIKYGINASSCDAVAGYGMLLW